MEYDYARPACSTPADLIRSSDEDRFASGILHGEPVVR